MSLSGDEVLARLAGRFEIMGAPVACVPHGTGHINDTFVASYDHGDIRTRYVHQRINTHVFPDPEAVMDNVARVLAHLDAKLAERASGASSMSALKLIPASDGRPFIADDDGGYWRTYAYVEGAETVGEKRTATQARHIAALFGSFQRLLADLPGPRLNETIAGFHDTPARYQQMLDAVAEDTCSRASGAAAEIAFAKARAGLATAIANQVACGAIPERISHNDTKLDNAMLDIDTGEGICVIDLDTVMPGSVLYDFGDMVRSATMTAAEDAPDASTVRMDRGLFEALTEGYLEATAGWLENAEKAALVLSCRVMTFECGVRFLTDYLEGDRYFKTGYPEHNLVRCRTQFALLDDMQLESEAMESVVRRVLALHPARKR